MENITFTSIDEFASRLKRIFAPTETLNQLYGQLASLKKGSNEAILDYNNRALDIFDAMVDKRKSDGAGYLSPREIDAITREIVDGYRDGLPPEWRHDFIGIEDMTLQEAFDEGIAIEKQRERDWLKHGRAAGEYAEDSRQGADRAPQGQATDSEGRRDGEYRGDNRRNNNGNRRNGNNRRRDDDGYRGGDRNQREERRDDQQNGNRAQADGAAPNRGSGQRSDQGPRPGRSDGAPAAGVRGDRAPREDRTRPNAAGQIFCYNCRRWSNHISRDCPERGNSQEARNAPAQGNERASQATDAAGARQQQRPIQGLTIGEASLSLLR